MGEKDHPKQWAWQEDLCWLAEVSFIQQLYLFCFVYFRQHSRSQLSSPSGETFIGRWTFLLFHQAHHIILKWLIKSMMHSTLVIHAIVLPSVSIFSSFIFFFFGLMHSKRFRILPFCYWVLFGTWMCVVESSVSCQCSLLKPQSLSNNH